MRELLSLLFDNATWGSFSLLPLTMPHERASLPTFDDATRGSYSHLPLTMPHEGASLTYLLLCHMRELPSLPYLLQCHMRELLCPTFDNDTWGSFSPLPFTMPHDGASLSYLLQFHMTELRFPTCYNATWGSFTLLPFKTEKYLFNHYLHFLKLYIINNYIYSLCICSRRLPLSPHVDVGIMRPNEWDSVEKGLQIHHEIFQVNFCCVSCV